MKKIAIIGGSYLQLPVVMKCKEMDIETHVFSWENGAVCKLHADFFYPISIIEKEAILEKCKEIGVNAICTISSDVAVVTVNFVADKMHLIANPIEYTQITTNKYAMRKALSTKNVPCPSFVRVTRSEIPDISSLSFPVIVKPTDRSGSRGVMKISDSSMLYDAIKRAAKESFHNEVIVEEYIEGREISVESISFNSRHYILQATDKVTTGSPFFVELQHHQPANLSEEMKKRVYEIVLKSLDALHIANGASHSELKITPDGDIKVIEIGARMGGDFIGSDLVRLSTGYDFLKGVVEVAFGEFKTPNLSEHNFSGVYFLCKETEQIKHYIVEAESYPNIVKSEITDCNLKEVQESADRSGYFIYKSSSKWICQ